MNEPTTFKKGDIVAYDLDWRSRHAASVPTGIVREVRSDYNGRLYSVYWFDDGVELAYRYWDLKLVCEAKVQ